ncbi:uncharacterized protein LOC112879961 [Panicum hallii]|uniref:uncharacterized protein LOC112879961 n=1 Tax=Panicum hallii TaxID=206008 RepID=UPI000DF4E94D|nr:uncharacterized protein LOC112879961 [Panicum hallii]
MRSLLLFALLRKQKRRKRSIRRRRMGRKDSEVHQDGEANKDYSSKCTVTGHYTVENQNKPLVLKELKKLWNKEEPDLPWQQGDFSPSNTLLVDDPPYKALRNPPHTAIFPYSYSYKNEKDDSLRPGGDLRLYLENLATADDVQRYVEKHPFGQLQITERNPNWKLRVYNSACYAVVAAYLQAVPVNFY